MSVDVALEHRTSYRFDRPTELGPHLIRLRPAPHCRTPIPSYSLTVDAVGHKLNWQQDPYGNFVARAVFDRPTAELDITVGLTARLTPINPFDFFLEPYAAEFGFSYPDDLRVDLAPYLDRPTAADPVVTDWLTGIDTSPRPTVNFLVELNAAAHAAVGYTTRMEAGVQTPAHTLTSGRGSCRDTSWLVVDALRHFGLAARFVSGYLIDLGEDESQDSTDLHAWAEAYLPGAGWVGLDPTSALLTGEGHIPLAATPDPANAAPITGTTGSARATLQHTNTVHRFRPAGGAAPVEGRRADAIRRLGAAVDERLGAAGLELTMGAEPTFVLLAEPTAPEWTVAAEGGRKHELAIELADRLAATFATGGLIQHGPGRWYPGEAGSAVAGRRALAPRRHAAVAPSGAARRSPRRRPGDAGPGLRLRPRADHRPRIAGEPAAPLLGPRSGRAHRLGPAAHPRLVGSRLGQPALGATRGPARAAARRPGRRAATTAAALGQRAGLRR